MEYVSRTLVAARFTGQNADELLSMVQMLTQYTGNTWSIGSNDGQTLVLLETPPPHRLSPAAPWPVQLDQYLVVAPDFGIVARMPAARFPDRYRALSAIFAEAAATPAVRAALRSQQEVGAAPIGIILLNASQVVTVTLTGAFPDIDYNVKVRAISGGQVLSMLRVTNIEKTAGTPATGNAAAVPATVKVTVQAVGVASLAGVLLVDALR